MNWYCIHTRPQKEESTRLYYDRFLGIETYLPTVSERRTIRRVRREVTRPLFPRYLFCRFEPAEHFRAVRYAPDAVDIVHSGRAPAIVPEELVEDLRRWTQQQIVPPGTPAPLRAGDVVTINDGPFMGLRAIVQQPMSDSERVALLLSLLDCSARVLVARSQVELVS